MTLRHESGDRPRAAVLSRARVAETGAAAGDCRRQAARRDTPLRFPGKVLADEAGGRLFIADSNHNRIVVTDLDGQLQHVIGSGAIGRADGAFETCSFNHPQGMALVGDMLYVADTENHLLRKVDLEGGKVTTIAGTGEKGTVGPVGEPPAAMS